MKLIVEQPAAPAPPTPPAPRPRCQHVSRNGRPCSYLAVSPERPFCKHHLPPTVPDGPEQFAHNLQRLANNFATPEDFAHVLDHIFFALIQGNISERKAGILTYIAHTILNSHRAIERRKQLEAAAPKNKRFMDSAMLTGNLPPVQRAANPEAQHCNVTDKLTWNVPRTPPQLPNRPSPASQNAAADTSPAESPTATDASAPSPSTPAHDPQPPQPSATKPALKPPTPPPPPDLNHFFPRDPSLPSHLQDPDRLAPPPPSPRSSPIATPASTKP